MVVYSCKHELEAMLTCIYVAWASGRGHKNIRLEIEPIGQYSLFDEYIHVDADPIKAGSVMDAVANKISPRVYSEIAYSAMAYEEDILDTMYRVMILGFAYGPSVLEMVHFKDVMRHREIRTRLGREANHFIEFIRFHEMQSSFYVAHIEPKSRLVTALASHFEDRLPSDNWMIVDDIHREAIVHPADKHFYLWSLSDEEFDKLMVTEKANDAYTDMWKTFFEAIAIKERENVRCQDNLFPKWMRKHAVEFN